jgi:hypothetical protein
MEEALMMTQNASRVHTYDILLRIPLIATVSLYISIKFNF